MYSPHTVCRACGNGSSNIPTLKESCAAGPSSGDLGMVPVFDLGIQPLANDFCEASEPRAGYAPLKLLYCPRCTLAQLSVVVDPEILYRKYCYVTSTSQTMQDHFARLAEGIKAETEGKSLLEIGSNDGALLERFKDFGFVKLFGVDPARNLCAIAEKRGINAVCNFFNTQTAMDMASFCAPDVILARHVFCHVHDWKDFIGGLEFLSNKDTLVCIEVPYVGKLMSGVEFDTIYHEHLSYLSVRAMQTLLNGTKLRLHRIINYPIHGGAILIMLRRTDIDVPPHISVKEYLNSEAQTMTLDKWKEFSDKASDSINNLQLFVKNLKQSGKSVAALGASAKSTVWVNACGFTRQHISWIADSTLLKQWKQSPGSGIPIVDEGAILRDLPDYVLCFAWNFKNEILEKNARARSKGVKFIFPVPTIEVV